MNIHEHEAKEILKKFGLSVPKGIIIFKASEIQKKIKKLNQKKLVLKAQIHAGGRGKAGGIKLVNNDQNLLNEIKNMLGNISSLMNALKGVGSFLGLFLVCFLIASGEETLMREGKILSATSSKFIGAALFMFYSLIIIASGTMLFFGYKNRK